jgi:hypothetical protein
LSLPGESMRRYHQAGCAFALLAARLLLAFFPLRIALRFGLPRMPAGPSARSSARLSDQPSDFELYRFMTLLGSRLPGTTCLHKALAARFILVRAGRSPELICGVRRKGDGRLDAHAWLEENGDVIFGRVPGLETYARLSVPRP